MTAPERIWATEDAENFGEDRFHTTRPMRGLTEYIRADLVADQIRAAVQAERDACAALAAEYGTIAQGAMYADPWLAVQTAAAHIAAAIRANKGDGNV